MSPTSARCNKAQLLLQLSSKISDALTKVSSNSFGNRDQVVILLICTSLVFTFIYVN